MVRSAIIWEGEGNGGPALCYLLHRQIMGPSNKKEKKGTEGLASKDKYNWIHPQRHGKGVWGMRTGEGPGVS